MNATKLLYTVYAYVAYESILCAAGTYICTRHNMFLLLYVHSLTLFPYNSPNNTLLYLFLNIKTTSQTSLKFSYYIRSIGNGIWCVYVYVYKYKTYFCCMEEMPLHITKHTSNTHSSYFMSVRRAPLISLI